MQATELINLIDKLPETITLEGDFANNRLYINGMLLSPKYSQKVFNHSPDGFNWGYGGSGPAQSALAILLHYWPKEAALKVYKDFKFNYIAGLPRTDFIKTVPLRSIIQQIINNQ